MRACARIVALFWPRHVPEDIQRARRVVPDPRHTRGGGRVPQGAGKKGTRPVAAVAGGRRHREHHDLRPAQRRSAGSRHGCRDDHRRPRSGSAETARCRVAHRGSPLHQVLFGHQEQCRPVAVRRTRRPRQPRAC